MRQILYMLLPILIAISTTGKAQTRRALAWEEKVPNAQYWTGVTLAAIQKQWATLDGAQDIDLFCPTYKTLALDTRQTVWGELFAALAYYESGWNPKSQYTEHDLGIDKVTGKPVVSEGLLQLSYGDITWATWCDFDWSADQREQSYSLTILNPKANLECGIGIMANQIRKYKNITLEKKVYWSTLRLEGQRSKIKEISKAIQTRVSECAKPKNL